MCTKCTVLGTKSVGLQKHHESQLNLRMHFWTEREFWNLSPITYIVLTFQMTHFTVGAKTFTKTYCNVLLHTWKKNWTIKESFYCAIKLNINRSAIGLFELWLLLEWLPTLFTGIQLTERREPGQFKWNILWIIVIWLIWSCHYCKDWEFYAA